MIELKDILNYEMGFQQKPVEGSIRRRIKMTRNQTGRAALPQIMCFCAISMTEQTAPYSVPFLAGNKPPKQAAHNKDHAKTNSSGPGRDCAEFPEERSRIRHNEALSRPRGQLSRDSSRKINRAGGIQLSQIQLPNICSEMKTAERFL